MRRGALLCAAAAAALGACVPDTAGPPGPTQLVFDRADAIRVHVARAVALEPGGVRFADRLTASGNVAVVADISQPALLVADTAGNVRPVPLRRGTGPGEFQVTRMARLVDGELWVSDTQRGGITALDTQGGYLRQVVADGTMANQSGDFVAWEGGALLPVPETGGAFTVHARGTEREPFAAVDSSTLPLVVAERYLGRTNLLAAVNGGVLLLDNARGRLLRLDSLGHIVSEALLPAAMGQELRAKVEAWEPPRPGMQILVMYGLALEPSGGSGATMILGTDSDAAGYWVAGDLSHGRLVMLDGGPDPAQVRSMALLDEHAFLLTTDSLFVGRVAW